MACFHPLKGYRAKVRNPSGKYGIVFNPSQGYTDLPIQVPCGSCIGCRIERTKNWAVRCVHESKMHEDNCFITLTYDNEHLPANNSLVKEHFQKFMKRLRKAIDTERLLEPDQRIILTSEKSVRYFHCGEYGDLNKRPHYHACMFNVDFKDKVKIKDKDGVELFVSPKLAEIWNYGYHTIGNVTYESAQYVASYIFKKISGDASLLHYNDIDLKTGEIISERAQEYVTMSRRPAIGKDFFDTYTGDIVNYDHCVVAGKELKPPKYYDKLYELDNPEEYQLTKAKRKAKGEIYAQHNTVDRLAVRERLKKRMLDRKKRSYECLV